MEPLGLQLTQRCTTRRTAQQQDEHAPGTHCHKQYPHSRYGQRLDANLGRQLLPHHYRRGAVRGVVTVTNGKARVFCDELLPVRLADDARGQEAGVFFDVALSVVLCLVLALALHDPLFVCVVPRKSNQNTQGSELETETI